MKELSLNLTEKNPFKLNLLYVSVEMTSYIWRAPV